MLEQFKGKLIISCQALPDEPLHSSFIMGRMALAAKQAGAVGIRAQSTGDITEIQKVTGLPIIGLIKKPYEDSEIYITPTHEEVAALIETGCEIIALDATLRKRPGDEKLTDLVNMIHAAGAWLWLISPMTTKDATPKQSALTAYRRPCPATRRTRRNSKDRISDSSPAWPGNFPYRYLQRDASIHRKT